MLGYLIAAIVGAALCVGIGWGVGALLARRRGGEVGSAAEASPDPPAAQAG
jgi:hypothetical protein